MGCENPSGVSSLCSCNATTELNPPTKCEHCVQDSLMIQLDFALLKPDLLMVTRVPAPPDLQLVIGLFHGRKSLCKFVRYSCEKLEIVQDIKLKTIV